ncbi:tetratricopeptide repeat-containing diguanylate cyclase [Oryzibacter oryziterrae]|uniref:tetratricopeptide repeat-containing diguanylate cyclase n=1 Tax=Oryzibacter oryziterrae TaxID=2766474 RepID=UPI001F3A3178|nr:tetratricopeptide repeat-containing diguanylate cyclase [Oryzibacter oryziterrae]
MKTACQIKPDLRPSTAQEAYDFAEAARLAGRYDDARALGEVTVSMALEAADQMQRSKALILLSKVHMVQGDPKAAFTVIGEATAAARQIGDDHLIATTLYLGVAVKRLLGLLEDAFTDIEQALEIATRLDDGELLYWCHNRAATLQNELGHHQASDEMMRKALAYAEQLGDEEKFCILNNLTDNLCVWEDNLAETGQHLPKEDLERALTYGERALFFARKASNPYREALILCNLGFVFGLLERFDEAFQALASTEQIAAAREYRSLGLSAIHYRGKILLIQKQPEQAISVLEAALVLSTDIAEDTSSRDICRCLATACEQIGDTGAALRHYRDYHQFDRKISSAQAALKASIMVDRVALMNARLEAEKAAARHRELSDHSEKLERSIKSLAALARSADEMALKDALTGLFNRHFLDREFKKRLAASRADSKAFSIVLVDVDHFKTVNDRFGHSTGDRVLKEIAEILRGDLRGDDVAIRYGGEEFMILLDDAGLGRAHGICERLRQHIANHVWDNLAPGLQVTASFGLAEVTPSDDSDSLIRRADASLYRAKNAGRNRIAV